MMYITKIQLENVRCFEAAEIDFGHTFGSIVVAGDNNSGKSTLLQAIAMGLVDEVSAGALLRDLMGEFVAHGASEAKISIELAENRKLAWKIETIITSRESFEGVSQKIYKWENPKWQLLNGKKAPFDKWNKIFAIAYGAGLRTSATEAYREYFAADAVYSLFKYTQSLQNPELAWRRLTQNVEGSRRSQFTKKIPEILRDILDLGPHREVVLRPNGICIAHTHKNDEVELAASGDGYGALTTIVLDLLGWQLLRINNQNSWKDTAKHWKSLTEGDISGICIIDEVETHLHPKLQLRVLKKLRSHFPKIQFIVTTHSPLVISSAGDIPTIFLEEGCISEEKHLQGWLAENVYQQMGIESSRPPEYREYLKEYRVLHAKSLDGSLTKKQKSRLKELNTIFKQFAGTDLVELDIEVENLLKALKPPAQQT